MSADREWIGRHFDVLVEEATRREIPADVLGRVLLQRVVALWLEHRSAADVASELRFAIEHLEGDEDFPFMRP